MKRSLYFSEQSIGYKRSLQQIIGSCQIDLAQFEASMVSYRKALELVDQSFEDQKHIPKGDIMHNIALGYFYLNKLNEAIEWYTKSLDMKQKRQDSPAKNYAIASILNSIGTC